MRRFWDMIQRRSRQDSDSDESESNFLHFLVSRQRNQNEGNQNQVERTERENIQERILQVFASFQNQTRTTRTRRRQTFDSDDRESQSSDDDLTQEEYFQKVAEMQGSSQRDSFDNPLTSENCKKLFSHQHPASWTSRAIHSQVEFEVAVEYHERFGSLGVLLYCSFQKLKFFKMDSWITRMEKVSDSFDFLTPLIVFYINSVKSQFVSQPASAQKFGLENLATLIGEAPSLKELRAGLQVIKPSEYLPYKCILDILGSFYSLFQGKQSKKYRAYLKVYKEFLAKVPEKYLGSLVLLQLQSLEELPRLQKAAGVTYSIGRAMAREETELRQIREYYLMQMLWLPESKEEATKLLTAEDGQLRQHLLQRMKLEKAVSKEDEPMLLN